MVSSKPSRPDDKGKVRIRFMEVELEGNNETLLEGIRNITSAMPQTVVVNAKQVPARAPTKAIASGPAFSPEHQEEETDVAQEAEANEIAEERPTVEKESRRARGPRPAGKIPPLAENLNIDGDPMPLRQFCLALKPLEELSDLDKTVAVAMWLKEHRQIDEVGASELYTCYKFMDWAPPIDPTSPMRNLKNKTQKMDISSPGKYRLTTLGERHYRGLRK